jgi:hypothetical protein
MQRIDVARFYQYSDAQGYAQILRQLDPAAQLVVMFDPGLEAQPRCDTCC